MLSQFFDEPQTKNWSLGSVVQNVQTDQAGIQVLIAPVSSLALISFLHFVIEIRYMATARMCQEPSTV